MFKKKTKKQKNKFAKLTMVDCGFCPRHIIKEHEKDGELFMKEDKPMCMICRATKLSKFRTEIENSRPAMVEDLKQINEQFEKEEFDRVVHIAAEAQEQVERVEKKL